VGENNKLLLGMQSDNVISHRHSRILCNKKDMNARLRCCFKFPMRILNENTLPNTLGLSISLNLNVNSQEDSYLGHKTIMNLSNSFYNELIKILMKLDEDDKPDDRK
jgi:hypothetical protein